MGGASSSITSCISARGARRFSGAAIASALCALTPALAGCGDDDEDPTPAERSGTVTAPEGSGEITATSTAPEAPTTDTEEQTTPARTTSPEDQPGGAGDEEAARSEAMLTGRGGEIRPRIVLVPPFIAIRVVLRSADGGSYELSAGGRRLRVGPGAASASAAFDGLRPGRRIVFRGTGGRVVIEASAEPGP